MNVYGTSPVTAGRLWVESSEISKETDSININEAEIELQKSHSIKWHMNVLFLNGL